MSFWINGRKTTSKTSLEGSITKKCIPSDKHGQTLFFIEINKIKDYVNKAKKKEVKTRTKMRRRWY
jgi:hypothetical protein